MKNKIIPYNPKLKQVARMLRKNMTLSEILLWQEIRGKRIMGYDFDRQRPIDEFVVDFYCKELMLAIEIDGDTHNSPRVEQNDRKRQNRLESLGVKFLRFDDLDVKTNIDVVIEKIEKWISSNKPTPESPPRRGL